MQNREYRRLCTKCGVRHYKPTGRKCTMSSPDIHLTPISSRRLSSATSCMQATMTTASIVTSLCTSATTTVTSSHMSSPRHLAGTPQGPMSSPHVVAPYPSSSAAVATSSSISVLPSTSAAAGPGIHAAVGSGSGSTGHPAAPIHHQPPPVQDQVVTTLHAMASIMSAISDRLTALERTDAPRPGPTPGSCLGAPAHQAQQPPVQMSGSGHSTYAPATAAPLPTTTQAMPTPAAVQAPPDMPTHPPHDLGVAARVQRELVAWVWIQQRTLTTMTKCSAHVNPTGKWNLDAAEPLRTSLCGKCPGHIMAYTRALTAPRPHLTDSPSRSLSSDTWARLNDKENRPDPQCYHTCGSWCRTPCPSHGRMS